MYGFPAANLFQQEYCMRGSIRPKVIEKMSKGI